MPVKPSYADRVFTTEVVSYPEMVHIGEEKDFTPVIEKALELGGYEADREMTGINGGKTVMTGFWTWNRVRSCRSGNRCCEIRSNQPLFLSGRL